MRGFILTILLVFTLLLVNAPTDTAKAQNNGTDQYQLTLQEFAWNRTTLQTLVVTPGNVSWWDDIYLNAITRAMGQWNEAMADFASGNPDYSYLSNVQFQSTITDSMQPGYDIYINWTDSSLGSDLADEIGLARIISLDKTIENCTITLAVYTNHGQMLSEIDMQNVALHELGHGLGLGHSNFTDDLMYSMYSLLGAPAKISTLNAYGVAVLFGWQTQQFFYPVSAWLTQTSVSSPTDIPYEFIAVSPANAAPESIAVNPIVRQLFLLWELLIHPEILVIVVGFVVLIIIAGVIARRRR